MVSCISDIFFGEFVFSSDGVDFAGCSCIMKVYVKLLTFEINSQSSK